MPRRLSWEVYDTLRAKYKDYLNYPLLPKANRYITRTYFISTLELIIKRFEGVPDLACRMLVKIAHYLLLVTYTFTNKLPPHRPWEIFLEGKDNLTFDINKGPNYLQLMGLYARTQFLPSYHMQTFEEIIITGFSDQGLSIFGPNNPNVGARYVAYKDAKRGDLAMQQMIELEEKKKQEEICQAVISRF